MRKSYTSTGSAGAPRTGLPHAISVVQVHGTSVENALLLADNILNVPIVAGLVNRPQRIQAVDALPLRVLPFEET